MTLLADSSVKAAAILAAAWIVTRLFRRSSADLRHRVWLTAILSTAILPLALRIAAAALPASIRIVVVSSAPAVGAIAGGARFSWMAAVWGAGVAVVLARLALGCFAASRMGRGDLIYSDRTPTPLTWGAIHPAIVLPAYMRAWSEAQRGVVIRHERAHIERGDWLWQTIARLVAAAFWFHPLVWLADFELRREAERAADDRVLNAGISPADYAEQLWTVATQLTAAPPSGSVAMACHARLEPRVREILDARRDRSRASLSSRFAIVAAAAVILLPLLAIAQDTPVYKIGGDVTAPRVLLKVEPKYTPQARDEKIQGTTVLRLVINTDGTASDFEVARSLDTGLDQSAIDAVSQWTFAPGTKDGRPVRVYATIEINFRLK